MLTTRYSDMIKNEEDIKKKRRIEKSFHSCQRFLMLVWFIFVHRAAGLYL